MSVLEPAAASSWAQKMTALVDGIAVVPTTDGAQTGEVAQTAKWATHAI